MKESYMGSCEKQTTLSVLYFLYVISFGLLQLWAKSKGSIEWHVLEMCCRYQQPLTRGLPETAGAQLRLNSHLQRPTNHRCRMQGKGPRSVMPMQPQLHL